MWRAVPSLLWPVAVIVSLAACRPSASDARAMLASTDPAKRERGARALRQMYAEDPRSLGDHGEAYWTELLVRVEGRKLSEASSILDGAQLLMGSEAGGGGASQGYRLDDFWTAEIHYSTRGDETVFSHEPPRRRVVHVEVSLPEKLTGTWITYYVNGAIHETIELEGGVRRRRRELHDNGSVHLEETYVDGRLHGTVLARDAHGAPEWEQTWANGKQVGVERFFHPNGKVRQEAHFEDDKLEGRLTNFTESGTATFCAEYRAGVRVDGGCP